MLLAWITWSLTCEIFTLGFAPSALVTKPIQQRQSAASLFSFDVVPYHTTATRPPLPASSHGKSPIVVSGPFTFTGVDHVAAASWELASQMLRPSLHVTYTVPSSPTFTGSKRLPCDMPLSTVKVCHVRPASCERETNTASDDTCET